MWCMHNKKIGTHAILTLKQWFSLIQGHVLYVWGIEELRGMQTSYRSNDISWETDTAVWLELLDHRSCLTHIVTHIEAFTKSHNMYMPEWALPYYEAFFDSKGKAIQPSSAFFTKKNCPKIGTGYQNTETCRIVLILCVDYIGQNKNVFEEKMEARQRHSFCIACPVGQKKH